MNLNSIGFQHFSNSGKTTTSAPLGRGQNATRAQPADMTPLEQLSQSPTTGERLAAGDDHNNGDRDVEARASPSSITPGKQQDPRKALAGLMV
jgi:hypothetical protein